MTISTKTAIQGRPARDIIVIGGSAGAAAPLQRILKDLPPELGGTILIAVHLPRSGGDFLKKALASHSQRALVSPSDGAPLLPGRIYLPVPDHHLLVVRGDSRAISAAANEAASQEASGKKEARQQHAAAGKTAVETAAGERIVGSVRLGTGPPENMSRPAIDALFRSAAFAYGPRVIGILLSGRLTDGSTGLAEIKRCGGIVIVQNPDDALFDEMPKSALGTLRPDYVADTAEIADIVVRAMKSPLPQQVAQCPDLELEVAIAAGNTHAEVAPRQGFKPSTFTCPDCGGVLSEVENSDVLRFRCQIGHGITAADLLQAQDGDIDYAMQFAMRLMNERADLIDRLAEDAERAGHKTLAEGYRARSSEYRKNAAHLRRAIRAAAEASGRVIGTGEGS